MQIISRFQTKLLQPFVIPAMNVAIFRQLHCHLLDRADNSLLIACIRGWAVSVVQRPYCQIPGIVTSKYTWGKNVILSWSIRFFLCSCYHTFTKQNTINSHKPRKIQTLQLHLLKKYGVTKLLIKKFSHFFNYFLPLVFCLVFLVLQPIVVVFPQPGSGLQPPRFRGFLITHNDAPQSVGFLWTSDQSVAETST